MKKNAFALVLFLLVGLVLGGVIGELFKDVFPLLNYTKAIGFAPFKIDLAVLNMTLGFQMRISLASIIGLLLGLLIYKRV